MEEANKKQPAEPVTSPTLRQCVEPIGSALPGGNRDPYSCWGMDSEKNPKPAPTLLGGAPATAPAVGLPGAAGEGPGKVTITTNEAGDCVAVTRTDDEGRILSVLWERGSVHSGYTQP
jgi:hypothetical protein